MVLRNPPPLVSPLNTCEQPHCPPSRANCPPYTPRQSCRDRLKDARPTIGAAEAEDTDALGGSAASAGGSARKQRVNFLGEEGAKFSFDTHAPSRNIEWCAYTGADASQLRTFVRAAAAAKK